MPVASVLYTTLPMEIWYCSVHENEKGLRTQKKINNNKNKKKLQKVGFVKIFDWKETN